VRRRKLQTVHSFLFCFVRCLFGLELFCVDPQCWFKKSPCPSERGPSPNIFILFLKSFTVNRIEFSFIVHTPRFSLNENGLAIHQRCQFAQIVICGRELIEFERLISLQLWCSCCILVVGRWRSSENIEIESMMKGEW
jgi:hypothetical protein